ncbi:hypothetical protein MRB53_021974 [Persea americana]|uniref:Uncharacterized protein n=1 Tax=Persea americana TaxID=3435 RepID=A0ACC2L5G8_PERAE|nr:hypothetical protein MRB53_021974 [Persea americana]|eukprot:TRINITY_DN1696_c0_g1_i1.p1 TRINITY_DN1696_c0_g1~~TRINITY_DN1696_c0_g1_i1.p1  ORF type:complete len:276 (+),score=44.45 TRINITY_DN1696_c0_g1_i1:359-1186(+)
MASQHYRSQFGDTTLTKVFVGGLAWETPTEEMRRYFEQFGEILEAVIITDKASGKSKGYGFVTFRDPESARRACLDANPVIDGRRANCNIASFGRPRPSPPRGRNQGGNPYQGGGSQQPATSYNRVLAAPPPPPPPFIYPPYGYMAYTSEYGYPQAQAQALYNPQYQMQYYHQMYGSPSSSTVGPYPYGAHVGYPYQSSGASFSAPQAHQRIPAPPYYLHYPAQGEGPVHTPSQPYSWQSSPLIRQPASLPAPDSRPSTTSEAVESPENMRRSSS